MVGSISIDDVVNACDEEGISIKGYRPLYHLLGDCLCQKGILSNVFPSPKRLSTTKNVCTFDVVVKLGEYHHFDNTISIASWEKTKSTLGQYLFNYNEFDNLFVDLHRLQIAMINFYGVRKGCK